MTAMQFLTHTLPNGLEIVAECNAEAYSAALGFIVKTGARDETDDVAGVSHFLEHMAFKGTPTRSADDVNRELDEIGSSANAATSEETTVYYAPMLPEYQSRATEILADILRPALRQADFDTEKKVIQEEIQMYEDQPPFCADDKCRAAYFGDHPLARSVLGTMQSIEDLPLAAMREYFRRRYAPGNIVLAAAGRIDFDRLVADCRRACGDWEAVESLRVVQPPRTRTGFQRLTKASATQQYIMQLSPGPTADDADRYAAKVLTVILGDSTGSRLFWELVDPGIAEMAELGHAEYLGAGVFVHADQLRPGRRRGGLRPRDGSLPHGPRPRASRRPSCSRRRTRSARSWCFPASVPRGGCSPSAATGSIAASTARLETDLDLIAAITLDEVAAVLKRYSLVEGTTLSIGP